MLAIIATLILILTFGSVLVGQNLSYLAMLIPLGFFAFLIYKFKKEGVVSIFLFLGGGLVVYGMIFSIPINFEAVIIGVIFLGIGYLLKKVWNVKIFEK